MLPCTFFSDHQNVPSQFGLEEGVTPWVCRTTVRPGKDRDPQSGFTPGESIQITAQK
jgi:hypothetical protein